MTIWPARSASKGRVLYILMGAADWTFVMCLTLRNFAEKWAAVGRFDHHLETGRTRLNL